MLAIRYCPECARPIEVHEARRDVDLCPGCGASLSKSGASDWVNVARVRNLAEAGFLADELAGESIDVRVYQADEFSALADRWSASFLLQTPPEDAQAAAARIRRYLAEAEAAPPARGEDAWDEDDAAVDPVFWRPVVLMVLAGVVSFVVGQKFAEHRDAARGPQRNTLPGAVSAIGQPFTTESQPGMPRHRLYYSNRQRAWFLDSDTDADGRYDSRRRFHTSGASW